MANLAGAANLIGVVNDMKEEHCVSEQSYERSLNCYVCKISEANMGKKHSAEHCAKLSEAKMGKKRSAATCAKMMGKKRSAATRAKISEALKGTKRSSATRAKEQGEEGQEALDSLPESLLVRRQNMR